MSEEAAWRTLARVGLVELMPADRVLLRRGSVFLEELVVTGSGRVSEPIVVAAYGAGELPVIRGDATCVTVLGSWVELSEVHVDGCSWAGVSLLGSNNVVSDALITNHAVGVFVGGESRNNRIVDNRLLDNNKMSVLTEGGDDDSGAFAVLLHGDGNEVASNIIIGSDAFSYDYGRDGAAVEVYGGRDNLIHSNLSVNNNTFAELGEARAQGNTFSFNKVFSALEGSAGFVTRGPGSKFGPVLDTVLYHNTVVLNGASSVGFSCAPGCGPDVLVMRNNILQAAGLVGFADAPFDEDYSVFFGGRTDFPLGPHSVVAPPGVIDPANRDFRLAPDSPAIDSAQSLPIGPAPIDGNNDGIALPDRGATEHHP